MRAAPPSRLAAAAALLIALTGCANLEPVRDFGRTAATITAYPEAGAVYLESAVASEPFVRSSPASFVAEPVRAVQVRAALVLQAELARYFALLAKLAGDTTFSLDAQVDALGKGVLSTVDGGLPKTAVDASITLVRTLVRLETSAAQLDAVRALVDEGGPPAMRILDALQQVAGDWAAQVGNDARQVDQTLQVAVLPGDVPPLVRLLAEDRRAALHRDDLARVRRLRSATTALARIRAAHDDLAAHLDELGSGAQLRARLHGAAAELRALRGASVWSENLEAAR